MLALCIGGAACAWSDLEAAEALIGDEPRIVIAGNLAGIEYPGHIDAWVTLHAEMFPDWPGQRTGNADYRVFMHPHHLGLPEYPGAEVVLQRWPGSTGLYMAQIALDHMGADKVILCGVPLNGEGDHIHWPDNPSPAALNQAKRYRAGFEAALPIIGPQVRSMSGWTAEFLGSPDPAWLGAAKAPRPKSKAVAEGAPA